MGYRHVPLVVTGLFFILPVMLPPMYAEGLDSLIRTNARGGLYSRDQQCWFSVPENNRLRLSLDGAPIYQGPGPTSVLLSAKKGEERQYNLQAERRSPPPEDALLESRSFIFYIDRKSPEIPRITVRAPDGGERTLVVETEPNSLVDAVVDIQGKVQSLRDLKTGIPFTGQNWSLIAWAKDPSGNWSPPLVTTLEDLRLDVENPVPGTWSNRQMLILSYQGDRRPRWTIDGKDPLGPTGQDYTQPVLLDQRGPLTLRVALGSSDGRRLDKTISYQVSEPSGSAIPSELGVLERLQGNPIEKETQVKVPKNYRWGIHSPPLEEAPTLTLRPVPGLCRPIALELANDDRAFRFAYLLSTPSGVPSPRSPSPLSFQTPLSQTPLLQSSGSQTPAPGDAEQGKPPLPAILQAGGARVAFWPAGGDEIRYTLGSHDAWKTVEGPIPLYSQATTLRWIVEGPSGVLGPYELPIPAVEPGEQTSDIDHVEYRDHGSPSEGWNYAAIDPSAIPRELKPPYVDVCDGEDLDIRVVGPDGKILTTGRLDRRAPGTPVLSAPAEGSFVSGSLRIGIALTPQDAQDREVRPSLRLIKTDRSGKTEELHSEKSITVDRALGEVYTVSLEAYSEDQGGNRSGVLRRNFTVDNEAIYVASNRLGGDGSRSAPLSSLDQALGLQKNDGRRIIKITGEVPLLSRWKFDGALTIKGSFDRAWNAGPAMATIQYGRGAALDITQGETTLESLRFTVQDSSSVPPKAFPLLTLSSSGSLNLDTVELSGTTTLIENRQRPLRLTNSLLILRGDRGSAATALKIQGGTTVVKATRVEVSGDRAVVWDQTGGELQVTGSYFVIRADKTATGLLLRDLRGNLEDLSVQAVGADYGNILDMTGGTLVWKGGTVQVKGRDALGFLLDGVSGLFTDLRGTVDSTFVGRGFELWKEFPQVHSCTFTYGGSSQKSELFYASHETASIEPSPKGITGNTIQGFSNLLDSRFLVSQVASFNQRYAPGEKKNVVRLEGNTP